MVVSAEQRREFRDKFRIQMNIQNNLCIRAQLERADCF